MFLFYVYEVIVKKVGENRFTFCNRRNILLLNLLEDNSFGVLVIIIPQVLFFISSVFCSSDMIYSEPYTHYRSRAEPQAPSEIHRRGDEILQIHHGHVSSIGNGQVRLQSNYNQIPNNIYANQRRDVAPILAFDPHLSRLISSSLDRRESSASATSSVGSSYESGSTLTSDLGDNAIMTRLRKSVEQKEEFLRGAPVTQSQMHGVNGDVGELFNFYFIFCFMNHCVIRIFVSRNS